MLVIRETNGAHAAKKRVQLSCRWRDEIIGWTWMLRVHCEERWGAWSHRWPFWIRLVPYMMQCPLMNVFGVCSSRWRRRRSSISSHRRYTWAYKQRWASSVTTSHRMIKIIIEINRPIMCSSENDVLLLTLIRPLVRPLWMRRLVSLLVDVSIDMHDHRSRKSHPLPKKLT